MSTNDETHSDCSGTNPNFWDCECDTNYIHNKSEKTHCSICDCYEEDQPDSMENEVNQMLKGE